MNPVHGQALFSPEQLWRLSIWTEISWFSPTMSAGALCVLGGGNVDFYSDKILQSRPPTHSWEHFLLDTAEVPGSLGTWKVLKVPDLGRI